VDVAGRDFLAELGLEIGDMKSLDDALVVRIAIDMSRN
jgi:hypothetical protein